MTSLDKKIQNKTVGVVFGGKSPEHDVSIITGMLVVSGLRKLDIPVVPIYIGTDGAWCCGNELFETEFLKSVHTADLYPLQGWTVDTRHRRPVLTLTKRPTFFTRRQRKTIDIVFPAMHGPFGEDGTLQGLCEFLGVPYTGCGVLGSSVAMNKVLTKRFFQANGTQTTPFVHFTKTQWSDNKQAELTRVVDALTFPLFVKPANGGSSIGISRVASRDALEHAIVTALAYDTECIVENAVVAVRDVTCCVRELPDGTLQPSLLQESQFTSSDFFSYEEKYLEGNRKQAGTQGSEKHIQIPAQVPDSATKQMQELACTIFGDLRLSGIGRVDFLYDTKNDVVYANEINPLPGTLYHHLWKATGVDLQTVLSDLLLVALRSNEERTAKGTYFASPILTSIHGNKLTK